MTFLLCLVIALAIMCFLDRVIFLTIAALLFCVLLLSQLYLALYGEKK